MNTSKKTAIHRKAPSVPMRWLSSQGMLRGTMLDYGCGHGIDADTFGMDKYDLNWFPTKPDREYDTITCNYVLNVIQSPIDRLAVLVSILARLKKSGTAYITVRADKKKLKGVTSTGTWQEDIHLDGIWKLVRSTSTYRTYIHTQGETNAHYRPQRTRRKCFCSYGLRKSYWKATRI